MSNPEMTDSPERLLQLLCTSEALGPWVAAALDDPTACDEFKAAVGAFLIALYNTREDALCPF